MLFSSFYNYLKKKKNYLSLIIIYNRTNINFVCRLNQFFPSNSLPFQFKILQISIKTLLILSFKQLLNQNNIIFLQNLLFKSQKHQQTQLIKKRPLTFQKIPNNIFRVLYRKLTQKKCKAPFSQNHLNTQPHSTQMLI